MGIKTTIYLLKRKGVTMSVIKKPPVNAGNNTYVFISYSSEDKELVYHIIGELQARGIRIWYDEDLVPEKLSDGKRLNTWKKQVEERISSDKCIGIFFFISENALEYREAMSLEIDFAQNYDKGCCYFSLIDLAGNRSLYGYIDKFFRREKEKIEDGKTFDDKHFQDESRNIREDERRFLYVISEDEVYLKYKEEVENDYAGVMKQVEAWGYKEDSHVFPDGNVIHNGHIEYFPAVLEATPFNYIYFLISSEKKNIASSIDKILGKYHDERYAWKGYSLDNFLKNSIQMSGAGLIIDMSISDSNRIELLLDSWRKYAHDRPIVVNIYAEKEEFITAAEKVETILQEINWGKGTKNKQDEIDSLILVQTDKNCMRQNSESSKQAGNIKDRLEQWRIWMSDRYYFEEVAANCKKEEIKWLLHQHISDCNRLKEVGLDKRMAERWDRERFRKQIFEWERK